MDTIDLNDLLERIIDHMKTITPYDRSVVLNYAALLKDHAHTDARIRMAIVIAASETANEFANLPRLIE
jgi:hypothetical protein